MKRIADTLFAPGLLAALVIVFVWPVILPPAGQAPPGDDIVAQFYPWSRIFVEGLRHGQLVLWNPYAFLGMPFQANPQTAEFYPATWLFAVMDAGAVFGVALALHLWLAAYGAYALARTFDVTRPGALLAAITFAFSGFFTSKIMVGFHVVFATLAWLPWSLAALHWSWKQKRLTRATLAGVPIALGGLAGAIPFFQFTLIAVVVLGLYLVAQSWRTGGRREAIRAAAQLLLALGCGLLIAAVQLVPTFELARMAARTADASYEFASGRPLPITHWLMLVMPDVFGAPVGQVKYWGAEFYHELQTYLGIVPLVLALLAAWRGDRRKWFWMALGGAALIYALGAQGFLHPLFYRLVPGISLMRLPARAAVLFVLSMSILAGLGWDQIPNTKYQISKGLLLAGGLAIAVGLLAFVMATGRASDATARSQWMQIAGQALRLAVLLGVFYAVMRWRTSPRPVFVVALFALTLVDLWSFGGKFVFTQPLQANSAWWPFADRTMAAERSSYRTLEYGFYIVPGTNDNILFHLSSLGGYDPLSPRDAVDLTMVNYGLEPKLLDMLAVRYILLNEQMPIGVEDYRVVARDPDRGMIIYERTPLSRAFIVHQVQIVPHAKTLESMTSPAFDPRQTAAAEAPLECALSNATDQETVTLVRDELDRVAFQARVSANGVLVMSDTFYPGWQAYVDSKPTPIFRVNYALRGICLLAGEHQVVFQFEPVMLRVGAVLSVIGLLFVTAVNVKPCPERSRRGQTSNVKRRA